jgi:hypothetical protein
VTPIGRETLQVESLHLSCRKFRASSADGRSTRWIAQDTAGAFMARETGQNKPGSYGILLKAYRVESH